MLKIILQTLISALRPREALILENAALRHQVEDLQRNSSKTYLEVTRSGLLGRPQQPLAWLASVALHCPTRDGDSVAPPRVSLLLEVEESTEMARQAQSYS